MFSLNKVGQSLAGLVVMAGVNLTVLSGAAYASPGPQVQTVRQEITDFANRYGNPVILHGALNLDAPVSFAYDSTLTSDQVINILSEAAGARASRVYFVTPAVGSSITVGASARQIIGNRGNISLDLHHVQASAAIEAVAASDNAQVRFPAGVPSGVVTFKATKLPLSEAVSKVASMTKTHWKLGYLLESTNPTLASMPGSASPMFSPVVQPRSSSTSSASTQPMKTAAVPWPTGPVIAKLPPIKPLARDANGNILPITIHFPTRAPVKPLTQAQLIQAEAQAAASGQYNNGSNAGQGSSLQSLNAFPSFSLSDGPNNRYVNMLGGSFGTFSTSTPNSSFSLVPDYGYPYGY